MLQSDTISPPHEDGIATLEVAFCDLAAGLQALQDKADLRGVILVTGTDHDAGPPAVLAALCQKIADFPVPVCAVIDASLASPWLDLAMACDLRVAGRQAHFTLLPRGAACLAGGGGLTRIAALCGLDAAVTIAGAADGLCASAAWSRDLVEHRTMDCPRTEAVRQLKSAVKCNFTVIKTQVLTESLRSRISKQLGKGGNPVAGQVTDVLQAFCEGGLAAGLKAELKTTIHAANNTLVRAFHHVLAAEKAAATPRGAAAAAAIRPISSVGVIGAGTMGSGIALAFAKAGYKVVLCEQNAANLDRGLSAIEALQARSVRRGSLVADEAARQSRLIRGAVGYPPLSDCDLIIEAAFEDMAVKKQIFAALDQVARPGAILATNTSFLDVNEIAAATSRPADVLGMHFFSPANVMTLLEVIEGRDTAADVIATILNVSKRIGKQPVVVGVGYGFVGNRMLAARNAAVTPLLLEGASPAQIDAAFRGVGWPMGPCQVADLAGIDVMWRVRQGNGQTDLLINRLYEAGRYGQKTRAGWYSYDEALTPLEDPASIAMIVEVAAGLGITRRVISEEEILNRTHGPLIEEGRRILDEGIARTASDIDVIYVHGYGFPRRLGGPMYWDAQGRP